MLVIFNCNPLTHNNHLQCAAIFWFKREGWSNTTAMHFLVWTWFMCPWAWLLPHLICTVSEHTLTMPETTFSSGLWHGWWTVPSHGTLVFTLIKWTGLWGHRAQTPSVKTPQSYFSIFCRLDWPLCFFSLSSFTCIFSKVLKCWEFVFWGVSVGISFAQRFFDFPK